MRSPLVPVAAAVAAALALAGGARANDGRDRYRGPTPAELRLFDPPASAEAGYRVLAADGQGGTDGDAAFRWARGVGVALVRVAARQVARALGPSEGQMAIFDLSAENADTPVAFRDGAPPRGRHPGGSHDGGANLDLGYYLTSLEGARWSPDLAACTDHFGPGEAGEDLYQCEGPPDRLDLDRQALFLLEVARVHHDGFGDGLIEEIGVDARVRAALLERLAAWARRGLRGASRALVAELARRMTSDRFEGWAVSHHHHLHLRLQRVDELGPARPAVEALLARERAVDAELAGPGPALLVRVRSAGLERSLDLRVLGAPAGARVDYRVDGGPWVETTPEDVDARAVVELETAPGREGLAATVEARLRPPRGDEVTLSRRVDLPRQDPELWVEVDPARIRVAQRLLGRSRELWLDMPGPYRLYVTGVTYQVPTTAGEPRAVEGRPSDPSRPYLASIDATGPARPAGLGRAVVELSGRLRVVVPFVVPASPP